MIDTIEEAVKNRIQDKLKDAAGKITVQRGVTGIPNQAVYVSIDEGVFAKATMENFSVTVTGFVDIIFSNLQDEEQRRRGVSLILAGIYHCLLLQTLGLKIDPIHPKLFRNITTEEMKLKGLIIFSLEFTTKFYIKKMEEDNVTELISIGLNYYLNPANTVADASDDLTLSNVNNE